MTILVSPQWLNNRLNDPSVIVVDASIDFQIPGEAEKDKIHIIPGARRFDYDKVFCDAESSLPHMMPSEERFNQLAQDLGLNQDSTIVVYDNSGVFASPRAWWMFKAMGHDNVMILDGGLTAWKSNGYQLETSYHQMPEPGNFTGKLNPIAFVDANYVLEKIESANSLTIDARSKERFSALVAEPRPGVRSGHIPGSVCIPFADLIDGNRLKSKQDLLHYFQDVIDHQPDELIFSCGSGVTACIVLLAAVLVDIPQSCLRVYDGSWTEWGQNQALPIEQ